MEDRDELQKLLLAGLTPSDRRHVVETISRNDAKKLRALRSGSGGDETIADGDVIPV